MAQSTTNLGKIHVFPSETLYNQFKDIIADNDLALLKDDGAYIVAANLAQNGYVKFSNGLILQWGYCESTGTVQKHSFVLPFAKECWHCSIIPWKTLNSGYCTVAYTVSKAEFEYYYFETTRVVSNCYIAIGV